MRRTYGPAFNALLDRARLKDQREVIRAYMLNREWVTLQEIAQDLRFPESSVSAQLRHLRKPIFGLHQVDKRRRGLSGTWEYRVRPKPQEKWSPGIWFDASGQGIII